MPVYDYHCDHCGHVFTAQQAMKDEPLSRCPECGKRPRRVPSRSAIVFKGSGWHVNDYPRARADSGREADADARAKQGEQGAPRRKQDGASKEGAGETGTKETKSPAKSETKD